MLSAKIPSNKVKFMNKVKSTINTNEGAVINIKISSTECSKSFLGEAVVDTGAEYTFISEKSASSLNLTELCKANIIQAHGSKLGRVVLANFNVFDNDGNSILHIRDARVIVAPMEGFLDCLIGRDILKHFVFVYDGKNQEFTLEA